MEALVAVTPASSRPYNKLASPSRSLRKPPGSIQLATAVEEALRRDERDNSAVLESIIDYWTVWMGSPELPLLVRQLRPFGRPRVWNYIVKVTTRLVTGTTTRHVSTDAEGAGIGSSLRSTTPLPLCFLTP